MKKITLLGLMLFCLLTTKAQTTDKELNLALANYMKYSKTLNIDKLVDYMYPKIFEIAPKASIVSSLSSLYNSDQFTAKLDSVYITQYFPVIKFSKGYFSKFSYGTILRMKFNDATDSSSQQKIFDALEAAYGEEAVTMAADQYFKIVDIKDAIAIKDNFSKNKWTFLGLKKDNRMILKLIPNEIKTAYKIK
jgi:hypothetical protein